MDDFFKNNKHHSKQKDFLIRLMHSKLWKNHEDNIVFKNTMLCWINGKTSKTFENQKLET